ncbi:uncharacterized protein LOC123257846 [Drosophila ananassae]|uniref:uncharacterized protein LOC123257846 n=1 Tax=Drosophila ananassae TaxID=7217 RepID=UPI001CFF8E27|nr:uncharacterized protein LOC123257846 [Drosophila ananassae]
MALKRHVNIEQKMRRNVDFARAYKGIMDDYVKKGYARRLEPQEVQRFQEGKLWYLPHFGVENPNKPGKIRLVFDAAAKVPCSADYVKTLNASQYTSTDPRAALAFKEYHYVDDYVDSFTSEEEAIAVSTRPATDEFKFGIKYHRVPRIVMTGELVPTKREFLSLVMSTFDPIGFLSFYMVTAKLLMREILLRRWTRADATAAHLRGLLSVDVRSNGLLACHLRGRRRAGAFHKLQDEMRSDEDYVDPATGTLSSSIGQRLMDTVKQEHGVAISSCVLWTDFKTVLHWISSTHRRFKQFVGNRVAEILESTEASQWRWIPSGENVADDATRPRKAVDLSIGSRWLSGPPFLRGPEESRPRSSEEWIPPTPDEEELRCEFALDMVNFISLQRFSNYNRLVRSTALVLRFIQRCRGLRYDGDDYGLTSMECAEAERALVRQSQREAFAENNQGRAAKGSQLHGLSPYFEVDGVMRASGRIDDAMCVPYSALRPIILCHDEALAEMIVQHHHERMCHQNTEATIGAIRQKFWNRNLRRLLRRVEGWSKCNVYKLRRARPTQPEMGPLPEDRLEANGWPFKFTGLDYFGSLFVTVGRRTEKRWVALFTCLTTRAIHLEMAHDLSTDSCIIAMRNFMFRRGPLVRIRSDNGKNRPRSQEVQRSVRTCTDPGQAVVQRSRMDFQLPGEPT